MNEIPRDVLILAMVVESLTSQGVALSVEIGGDVAELTKDIQPDRDDILRALAMLNDCNGIIKPESPKEINLYGLVLTME